MAYKQPKGQALQSLDVKDYRIVAIVSGSRGFNDKKLFHEKILDFLEDVSEPVLFISGEAHSGPDDFIISWCKRYGYPCKRMPADWEKHGRSAGYIRNIEMAKIATNLISFWDGISPGTAHMIEQADPENYNLIKKVIMFKGKDNGKKSSQKNIHVVGSAV